MVLDEHPVKTSVNTNINHLYNIYIFTAGASNTNYTYTLPAITVDGINFKITRNDNIISSSLQINTSGENIIYGSSTLTSLYVEIYSFIIFLSYDGKWYVIENTKLPRLGLSTIFSGAFIANNGNPYYTFAGNKSSIIASFSYIGSFNKIINYVYFGIFGISTPLTAEFQIRRSDKTTIICTTGGIGIVSGFQLVQMTLSNANKLILSTTLETISIFLILTNANGKSLGFLSFIVVD